MEIPPDLANYLRYLYPRDSMLSKYDTFEAFINYINSLYPEMVQRYGEEKAKEMIMQFFEQPNAFLKTPEEVEAYLLGRPYKREQKQLVMKDKRGMGIPVSGGFAKAVGYPSGKKEERYMTKGEIAALPYEYRVSCVKDGQQFSFTCYTADEAYDLARELKSLGAKDINIFRVPKSQG